MMTVTNLTENAILNQKIAQNLTIKNVSGNSNKIIFSQIFQNIMRAVDIGTGSHSDPEF